MSKLELKPTHKPIRSLSASTREGGSTRVARVGVGRPSPPLGLRVRCRSEISDFSQKQQFLHNVYEKSFQGFCVKVADTQDIV